MALRDDYLCVDRFLGSLADARALAAALELGLVDALADGSRRSAADLRAVCRADRRGMGLLLDLLGGNGVVEADRAGVRLTPGFRSALAYRDLLEAKLSLLRLALPDFIGGFTTLLRSPPQFTGASRLFDLFDYGRAVDCTPGNVEHTRRWVRITTAWARYEAGPCMRRFDFAPHRRMLDVGGNSGEFLLRICRRHPDLRGTVLDLPAVCRIGREHVAGEPEADRIAFVEGNALRDPLPAGHDLISFKSMLHDWPEAEAGRLMERAHDALPPGGTLLIFERAPVGGRPGGRTLASLPFLLFSPWFRSPDWYVERLRRLGFREVRVRHLLLDTPFFLVRGRKAQAR